MVNEYCQRRSAMPRFDSFQAPSGKGVPPGCSCVLTFPESLPLPDVSSKTFGDKHRFYRTKMAAKKAASKEAMQWIFSVAPDSVKGTQPASKISDGTIRLPRDMSFVQRVNVVCPHLNLGPPEWDIKPDPTTPGVYDVCVIIRRRNGPKDVKIGPLQNEFGKRRAKERLAQGVLRWLYKEAEKADLKIVQEA